MKLKIFFLILSLFFNILICDAETATDYKAQDPVDLQKYKYFPKTNLINIIKDENYTNESEETFLKRKELVNDFITANTRFEQSNISSSYKEYEKLTNEATNDFIRIALALELSVKGFFSLAETNLENVKNKEIWQEQINYIKEDYLPTYKLSKEEEIKLAEFYTDIIFNNLAFETAKTLPKEPLIKKSDYANYILAYANLEAKDTSKALNLINKAISMNKYNLAYHKLKARIFCENKKFDEAEKIVNSLLKEVHISEIAKKDLLILKAYIKARVTNKEANSKYYLANYLFLTNDLQRAIKEANTSIYLKKKNPESYNLLGNIYLKENNIEKAEENFNKALKINKRNQNAILGLANVEFYKEHYDKAIEKYLLINKKEKYQDTLYVNLAASYLLSGNEKQALLYSQKAIENNPRSYKALYIMSLINDKNKIPNLKKVVAYNPFCLCAWSDLAYYSIENKDIQKAKEYITPYQYMPCENYIYYYCKGEINLSENKKVEAYNDFMQSYKYCKDFLPTKNELEKLIIQQDEKTKKNANTI